MKIKRVEVQNDLLFGNVTFDFTDSRGQILDNIVIAGENGSGKTRLLNLLYDFSRLSTSDKCSNEIRHISMLASVTDLAVIQKELGNDKLLSPTGVFEITQDFRIPAHNWDRFTVKYLSQNEDGRIDEKRIPAYKFLAKSEISKLFRTVYSTVEINYNPKEVSNVTSKDVDETIVESLRSSGDLASEIQQLFVDIQANDANDLQIWVDNNPNMVPPSNVINSRITRFKNAFSKVFDNMNYDRIVTQDNKKIVIFKKFGRDVKIASLSSGEKQIVFRGAFLLRNQQSAKGCGILIDEPEISLHPLWQSKIFEYYRRLFVDSTDTQCSQLFFATHSQYVLQSTLAQPNNTVILLLAHTSTGVSVKKMIPASLTPTLTAAELNYMAFDVISNDYHIELYGRLQSKVASIHRKRTCSVKECDTYISKQTEYIKALHEKKSTHTRDGKLIKYKTLPTFIRNAIDHPDPARQFTQSELQTSIELLIKLC